MNPSIFNKEVIIKIIFCIFPVLAFTLKDAGSSILVLLFLISTVSLFSKNVLPDRREQLVLGGFLLFFLVSSVSLIETENIDLGLKKLERILRLVLVIPIFLMLVKNRLELGRRFIYALVVTSFVLFIQTLYQMYFLGLPTAQGAYHQILFGEYAMLIFGLLIAIFLVSSEMELSSETKIIVVFGSALALTVSVLSESKGAWLAFPVIITLLVLLFGNRLNRRHRRVATIVVLLVLGVSASLPSVQTRMSGLYSDYTKYQSDPRIEGTLSTRLNMWRDSWTIFRKSPILGTGLGDYKGDVQELMKEGISFQTDGDYSHPHSIYFDMLATAGILGFSAMIISLIVLPFRYFYLSWKLVESGSIRLYSLGGMITVVAYSIFGLSESWISQNAAVNVYSLFVMIFMYSIYRETKVTNP